MNMGSGALRTELAQLETETFEIDDVADVGENMASTSTSSTCSSSSS
jgi:thiazolylpeptide-type bacteriocin precursor